MKATVEYKGKQVSFEIPDETLDELLAKQSPRTGYERVGGTEKYWCADAIGRCCERTEDRDCYDREYFSAANYTTDERLARGNALADTLMRKLRRYAAEHGGIPSVKDWEDEATTKWHVRYMYDGPDNTRLYVADAALSRSASTSTVYFISKSACEAAMHEFRAELEWYFTQYEGQVRE